MQQILSEPLCAGTGARQGVNGPLFYTPKVPLDLNIGRYRVHTAVNDEQLEKVLALRKAVFAQAYRGQDFDFLGELDTYDLKSDVLMIEELKSGAVVGAYRLIATGYTSSFYSESEFDLDGFVQSEGMLLELSRACIAPEHRNGIVIALLWRGLALYAQHINAQFLFGLSSVNETDPIKVARLYRSLKAEGFVDHRYGITPKSSAHIEDLSAVINSCAHEDLGADSFESLPPLLRSYLKAGARICAYPVLDHDFGCSDFLTILPWVGLKQSVARRFGGRT